MLEYTPNTKLGLESTHLKVVGTIDAAFGVEFKYTQTTSLFQMKCCLILSGFTLLLKGKRSSTMSKCMKCIMPGVKT